MAVFLDSCCNIAITLIDLHHPGFTATALLTSVAQQPSSVQHRVRRQQRRAWDVHRSVSSLGAPVSLPTGDIALIDDDGKRSLILVAFDTSPRTLRCLRRKRPRKTPCVPTKPP
jgi:hypothetical protein